MANEGRDVERDQPHSRLLAEDIKGRSSAAGNETRNRIRRSRCYEAPAMRVHPNPILRPDRHFRLPGVVSPSSQHLLAGLQDLLAGLNY